MNINIKLKIYCEQYYNALMVKKYNLGIIDKISYKSICNFIEKRKKYQSK